MASALSKEHYDLLTLVQWRLFQVRLCMGVLQLPSVEEMRACDIDELEDEQLMQDFQAAITIR